MFIYMFMLINLLKQGYYIILTLTLHSDNTFIVSLVIIYLSSVTVPRGFWRGHAFLCKYRGKYVTRGNRIRFKCTFFIVNTHEPRNTIYELEIFEVCNTGMEQYLDDLTLYTASDNEEKLGKLLRTNFKSKFRCLSSFEVLAVKWSQHSF